MNSEDNRAIIQRWFDLWNQHDLDRLAEFVSPNYVHHGSAGNQRNFDQFKQGFQWILNAFPDVHYTVEHVIAEGEMVAVYLSAVATHQGEIFGIPPTGRSTQFTGVYHCRIRDGQIVEDWDIFDILNALFRLGATIKAG